MNQSIKIAGLIGALSLLAVTAAAQATYPSSSKPATTPASQASPRASTSVSGSTGNSSIDSARFKSLDTDGDGRVSRSEFTAGSSQITGNTGMATETGKEEKKHWWSRKSDDSKSSDVAVSERQNSIEQFNQLDTNKDGFLTSDECAAEPNKIMKK
jgi:hypothetical protein